MTGYNKLNFISNFAIALYKVSLKYMQSKMSCFHCLYIMQILEVFVVMGKQIKLFESAWDIILHFLRFICSVVPPQQTKHEQLGAAKSAYLVLHK